jgi:DUF1009 family protein
MLPKLGILAGGGQLPLNIVEACRIAGREFFVVALEGCAQPGAFSDVPHAWSSIGAVGKMFQLMRSNGVVEIVLAGAVKRPSLSEIRPDLEGALLMAKFAARALGDDGVLAIVVREIESRGFRVVGAHDVMKDITTPLGQCGRIGTDPDAERDIDRGLIVARALGTVDVGQAVIVQQGIVLGVESVEGTDALIKRSGDVRRSGVGGVLVKISKPNQERRADLPTIGPQTVQNAAAAGLRGIALEAGNSIIVERESTIAVADELKLFVVGVKVDAAAAKP